MNRRCWAALPVGLLLLLPSATLAQTTTVPASAVRARAGTDRDTTLMLGNVRLLVPAGATATGAMIALGVGGVPSPGGTVGVTGLVLSVSEELRGPVAVVIDLSAADRRAAAGYSLGLIDTASGAHHPCVDIGVRIACLLSRPGAYVVGGTALPAGDDPFLTRALAMPPSGAHTRRYPVPVVLAVLAVAGLAGGAAAGLLGRKVAT